METRKLILVDMMDRPVGTGEKGEVHAKGLLHRAFSLFLQDQEGRVLLQQRAMGKYHSGGLWTNSCCSHPAPGDSWEAVSYTHLDVYKRQRLIRRRETLEDLLTGLL